MKDTERLAPAKPFDVMVRVKELGYDPFRENMGTRCLICDAPARCFCAVSRHKNQQAE